jgi:hypothetical protein
MRMPDFIIIGAMKCATSTLHEQLARQPGIFMSTPKEPCFFSDDDQWAHGESWYASLFNAAAADDICGESSTHYTKLPTHPHTVARMKRTLPSHVKFIYIMRHPIDRLISHYIHEWTQRVMSSPIDEAVRTHAELVEYGMYAAQLEPYCVAFGESNILPVFFERLTAHPQTELERVCRFIGYQGSPRWHDDVAEENRSSERLRRSRLRDAVINLPGLKQARRALVPKSVREWVKGFWSMKQRPHLSPPTLARLTEHIDGDLARLGRWFGLELRCDNFKQVAAGAEPAWRPRAEVAA